MTKSPNTPADMTVLIFYLFIVMLFILASLLEPLIPAQNIIGLVVVHMYQISGLLVVTKILEMQSKKHEFHRVTKFFVLFASMHDILFGFIVLLVTTVDMFSRTFFIISSSFLLLPVLFFVRDYKSFFKR